MAFINYDILKSAIKQENNENVIKAAIEDVENLVKLNSNRNHIEIEKKYISDNRATFEKVKKAISDLNKYEINRKNDPIIQEDYYYDTVNELLFRTNKTLRFRKIDNKFQLTIKTPTKSANISSNDDNSQSERFEYEIEVDTDNIEYNKQYIVKYLPEIADDNILGNLINTLIVKNKREKLNIVNDSEVFEIVFDDVKYINSYGVETSDLQIEIELKSDYLHRINLKMLTDYLEKNISELKPLNESKYKRGLTLTKSCK